jgi:urate oxidase
MATSLVAQWRFTSPAAEWSVDWEAVYASAPNKHHFRYDLSRFGLENNNEVFHADDRPYGLIQATVTRDDAPDPGPAWDGQLGWLA